MLDVTEDDTKHGKFMDNITSEVIIKKHFVA